MVAKLVPAPVEGEPPVAVQEKVTAPVAPIELAVHETVAPTVPVVGQFIETVKDGAVTMRLNDDVLTTPLVDVAVTIIVDDPAGVDALVTTLI